MSQQLQLYKIGSLKADGGNNANSNIIIKDVSADPAWTDQAVLSSKRYAPTAFNITQPLTVFMKGDLVVGFDVTNPTDVLNNQVIKLQQQVTALVNQVGQLQTPTAAAPPAGTGSAAKKKTN